MNTTITEEEEEEEEAEEEREVRSGGARSEKNAQLLPAPRREGEEDEDKDKDKDKDKDMGDDTGLENHSPAHPGTAHSPSIQPCPQAIQPTPRGEGGKDEGEDEGKDVDIGGDGGLQNCSHAHLGMVHPPPIQPCSQKTNTSSEVPVLVSSNTMDVDQANCNLSNVPTDSVGSTEVAVATGHHRGQRDGFQEVASDPLHGTEDRGRNPSTILAPQMSSQ